MSLAARQAFAYSHPIRQQSEQFLWYNFPKIEKVAQFEWHVDYESGVDRLPKYQIRKNYVEVFVNNFKHSYFLMRYPVIESEMYKTGLIMI